MAYRKRKTTARRTTRAAPRSRSRSTRRAAAPRQQTVRIVLQQAPASPIDMLGGLTSPNRSAPTPRKPIAG